LRPAAAVGPPRPVPRRASGEKLFVEVVLVGREMLRGRVPDGNGNEIAAFCSQRGALVRRITTVDDDDRAVASAITDALNRGARLVVTAGGLGPMADDRTLAGVSDALKVPLAPHHGAKELVEAAYRRMQSHGRASRGGVDAARENLYLLPIGAEPVENSTGTAPGVIARVPGGAAVLCLPGVPAEMRAVLDAAQPALRDLAPRGFVARREVETPTSDESSLRPLLDQLSDEFPHVWVKSHAAALNDPNARIRVTLEANSTERTEAESLVEDALRRLLSLATAG